MVIPAIPTVCWVRCFVSSEKKHLCCGCGDPRQNQQDEGRMGCGSLMDICNNTNGTDMLSKVWDLPIDGFTVVLMEELIDLGIRLCPEESALCREWRGMS